MKSIIDKLKDKTVVMAILGYILTICTTLGISIDVNNVNIIAVSICGIMTILGIMHDSGSTTTTTTVIQPLVSNLTTGEEITKNLSASAQNTIDNSNSSVNAGSADTSN
jgi:uncharacterized membrane protein